MKVTVFTSNQPRHVALIEALAQIADSVFAVQECNTVFPGQVDDFFRRSEIMRDYFARVIAAEEKTFGRPRFLPANVRSLSIKMGDLNRLNPQSLGAALEADVYVVFGAGFIKGPLCEHLVGRGAINIHMGVSPYYRGSSTNFWALYDGRPEMVGATVHRLSAGLDSGPMLFHALPKPEALDPFELGMKAVQAGHDGVVKYLAGTLGPFDPVPQDRGRELRYTRNAEFTDEVAAEYLTRLLSPAQIRQRLERREAGLYLRPYVPA